MINEHKPVTFKRLQKLIPEATGAVSVEGFQTGMRSRVSEDTVRHPQNNSDLKP
jgi:hypothetical protein